MGGGGEEGVGGGVCAAEKVMVFGVLSVKQGIQFNCLAFKGV